MMKSDRLRWLESCTLAIMVIGIMSSNILTLSADSRGLEINNWENITISIENDSNMSDNEALKIRSNVLSYHLYGEIPETVSTCGLTCTIFGHDTKSNIVSVVEHKVEKKAPRCKETIYNVTTCNRCDYEDVKFVGSYYIDCCPED